MTDARTEKKAIAFDSFENLFEHTLQLAKTARRQIIICAHDLEPDIYGSAAFTETVLALIKGSRQARVQVLAAETKYLVESGHPFLRLLRRADEQFQIKKYNVEPDTLTPAYLICDDHSMLRRQDANTYKGFCYLNDRARVQNQLKEFEERWATAQSDPNLRQLSL